MSRLIPSLKKFYKLETPIYDGLHYHQDFLLNFLELQFKYRTSFRRYNITPLLYISERQNDFLIDDYYHQLKIINSNINNTFNSKKIYFLCYGASIEPNNNKFIKLNQLNQVNKISSNNNNNNLQHIITRLWINTQLPNTLYVFTLMEFMERIQILQDKNFRDSYVYYINNNYWYPSIDFLEHKRKHFYNKKDNNIIQVIDFKAKKLKIF